MHSRKESKSGRLLQSYCEKKIGRTMMSAEVDKKEEEKEEDNEEKKDPSKDGVIVEPNKDETVRLRRVLSVWDASAYIVCSIIGSGIFISPKGVILRTGSGATALLMWAATGGINLVVAFCYAELALTFPETGSEYTYIRKAFGEAPAFLLMWVLFVFQHGCAKAILALTFATYFGQMFWTGCPSPEVFKKLVAALALTVLTAIGCYSSRWAVRLSDFFTAAKLVGLALIVVTGLGYAALEDASLLEWHNFSRDSSSDVADYALAYYAALWAYGGLQNAINVVEELKEPVTSNVVSIQYDNNSGKKTVTVLCYLTITNRLHFPASQYYHLPADYPLRVFGHQPVLPDCLDLG